MIIDWCEQGTDDWMIKRSSIPTASEFDKIMTQTGKASTQADAYCNKLIDCYLTGKVREGYTNDAIEHGKLMESEAREVYEFITGNDVVTVGMVFRDEEKIVACSPDGLLSNMRRGVEIKCPQPHTHIGYMLHRQLPSNYVHQVQGCMYITGYKSWDFVSYHPDYPPVIVTIERDNKYINNLHIHVEKFLNEMMIRRKKLEKYKYEA